MRILERVKKWWSQQSTVGKIGFVIIEATGITLVIVGFILP